MNTRTVNSGQPVNATTTAATAKSCPYSISRRLSWLLAVQTVVGLGVLLAFIYGATSMLFAAKHEEELRSYTHVLVDVVQEADTLGGEAEVKARLAWLAERRPGTFVEVQRADGSVFYRDAEPTFNIAAAATRGLDFSLSTQEAGELKGKVVLDCSQDAKTARRMAFLLVGAVLAGAALVGWGTYWRVRCSFRPLLDLAAQTKAIDARHLGQRLSLQEPAEELQPLIDQFNGLMQRVERTYAQLEGFNADVAHELRTPLATLIGQTELALSGRRSENELRETLGSNLEELQRLAGIVNDMLFLSQADRGAQARGIWIPSLAQVLSEVVDYHEAEALEAGLSFAVSGEAAARVDRSLLQRAVSNLVSNAVRYAHPGSRVDLLIDRGEAGIRVAVRNQGDPIDQEHLPRLFYRFYRMDAARPCDAANHHGLGLAIVAAIARMHGGRPFACSEGGVITIGFWIADRHITEN